MKELRITLGVAMGVAIILSLAGAAWAANCGGGVACSCGDTVNANTVLDDAFDPVVSTDPFAFCTTTTGLTVNGGVTLDLGGKTIRGNHTGTGVKINGDNAVVTNGTIRGFNIGLSTAKAGGTISKIKALRNKTDGIKVTGAGGHDNTLLSNTAEENGIDGGTGGGISVAGADNTVRSNKANRNTGIGIEVTGDGTTLDKNTAEENSKDGIKVAGDTNEVTSNKASNNRENGINVSGDGNTLEKNTAHANFGSGIILSGGAESNTLDGNKADKNSGDGVSVNGKKNSLKKNTAKQNDGEGVFAKFQADPADKNIDNGGNKGTNNGGVDDDGLVGEVNCEIDEVVCLP